MKEIYQDSRYSPKERAEDLRKKMTLEEKLAQMTGYNPAAWSNDDLERDFPYGAGQVNFFGGIELKTIYDAAVYQRRLQKKIMEKSRFGIPAIFHVETLCGVMLAGASSFPSGIGQAASFDSNQEKKMGELIGKQARAVGASQAFSPVLDISRDPRFGRQGETYGEDPVLASAMGCAVVSGLQQDGDLEQGVLATAKHFLGYHCSEGGIHAAACDIPERLLREIYAKPFQAAITEAKMQGIMPCYSSINGEPVAGSARILTNLLRKEMGFQGLTVSDYSAVEEIFQRHGVGETYGEAEKRAILAGMHQELPSAKCFRLEELQKAGIDDDLLQKIDETVELILEEKFRLGLFEHPFAKEDSEIAAVYENPENEKLMEQSAKESLVLVKNQGVLPIKAQKQTIAVIGYHAASTRALFGGYTYMSMTESFLGAQNTMAGFQGGTADNTGSPVWSGTVVEKEHPEAEKLAKQILPGCRNLLEELQTRHPEVDWRYAFGYPYTGDDCSWHEEAIKTAEEADLILMTVGGKYGTGSTASMGEGIDGTNINLPACQESLLRKLKQLGKPITVVHFGGRPISSDAADACADAILEAWNPGEKGADAIVSVLFGEYTPGGKMPLTTPYNAGQIPVYYNHPNGTSWHQNTISAFRQYMDCPHEPRYCFGYGLSYTEFQYSGLEVKRSEKGEDILLVSLQVENTGRYAGDEVVQLYIQDPHASIVRPVKELAGFYRVHLKQGQKKKILFEMKISQFAFLDIQMKWKVEKGELVVLAGSSSEDIRLRTAVSISEDRWIEGRDRGFFAKAWEA